MEHVQIAVLDNQALRRNGLRMLVKQAGFGAEQVFDFADLKTLMKHLDNVCTRILVISDELPMGQEIVKIVKKIYQYYPSLLLIVVGSRLNIAYIRMLLTNGVRGYVYYKSKLEETIPIAIKSILKGETYLSPKVAILPYHQRKVSELDERDLEVLGLLAAGRSVPEIAQTIGITRRVVYSIRSRLKQYLQVNNNEQILIAALEQGLLID